jgi:hypothetical protein
VEEPQNVTELGSGSIDILVLEKHRHMLEEPVYRPSGRGLTSPQTGLHRSNLPLAALKIQLRIARWGEAAMSIWEVLRATVFASLWFSWVALLIAAVPTLVAFVISSRKQYLVSGFLGGLAGEFCGVGSLFLSFWFSCRGQGQSCNTAQGDMGLMITAPVGSLLGCLLALCWNWATLRIPSESPWASVSRYSGASRVKNWTYAIAIPIAFWVLTTLFLARLMA